MKVESQVILESEMVGYVFKKENLQKPPLLIKKETVESATAKPGRTQCNQCNKVFTRPWCLKVHLKTHDQTRKDECKLCLRTFVTENHQLKSTCEVCSFKTCSEKELKIHTMAHRGEVKLDCQSCKSKFNQRNLLRKHEASHADEFQKPFSCITG